MSITARKIKLNQTLECLRYKSEFVSVIKGLFLDISDPSPRDEISFPL